jgi:ketosteroid isomerase-like protein
MEEHPEVGLFRRVHEAFSAGDMDALAGLCVEDVSWHARTKSAVWALPWP